MADRLRALIDLVVASLDDPGADGRALAGRAHLSRDHLDRLLAGRTGETPVALRRRLLLERAAWQLRTGAASASEPAAAAGYGSAAAFSRAFARAHGVPPSGVPPSAFAACGRPVQLGEASAAVMAERLVLTLEVWIAAVAGEPQPPARTGDLSARLAVAAPRFSRLVGLLRERGAWDDAFVDALCEPPQSFSYGGVVAHVLTFGAVRREALAGVLAELGAPAVGSPDPLDWEAGTAQDLR